MLMCNAILRVLSILSMCFNRWTDHDSSDFLPREKIVPTFLSTVPKVSQVIAAHVDTISNEALIKLVRQLEFWHEEEGVTEDDLVDICKDLMHTASMQSTEFVVPKVRFGKTEIQIPIVTCGGMRLQQTWMPDNLPIAPSKTRVLKSDSQANLKQSIRLCLKVGINHFETARMYGSSEYQFAQALYELIESGEIKREDFILQTKVVPKATRKEFDEVFSQSWLTFADKLGYIDLFSFHCVSPKEQVEWVLSDADDMCMATIKQYQMEGKIKHIGFSTHGTAANIMTLINSEKFSYVNLHCHFFGDYHAEGTPDTVGGHGNKAAVKRALELDMGVFNISPIDKGGMMYAPSKPVVRAIGSKMSPITFVALNSWKTSGMHTISIGFARPSDLDEALRAAEIFVKGGYEADLRAAEDRLVKHAEEKLGSEWMYKGMLNLSDCEQEPTDGTAIGHVIWCHNLMSAYGMYEFCRARYKNLEDTKWNAKKSFEENRVNMPSGNMGRAFIAKTDYTEALKNHYNPDILKSKMAETHEWLASTKSMTNTERQERGWDVAYDLRVWESFPGDSPTIPGVVLSALTGGWLGCGGKGPTQASKELAREIREAVVA